MLSLTLTTFLFLLFFSNILPVSSVESFPRLHIETDKDEYFLGEIVKMHIFLDDSGAKCLCYKHSWLVEVRTAEGLLVKKWEWEAKAGEKTFLKNTITWLPEKSGTYDIIVRLKEHDQNITKTIKIRELQPTQVIKTVTITENIITTKIVTSTYTTTITKEKVVVDMTSIFYLSILITLLVIIAVESIIILRRTR